MNLGLNDKVVFVAGSSHGIGKAIAYSFLDEGANIVVTGRQPDAVKQCTEELKEKHEHAVFWDWQAISLPRSMFDIV